MVLWLEALKRIVLIWNKFMQQLTKDVLICLPPWPFYPILLKSLTMLLKQPGLVQREHSLCHCTQKESDTVLEANSAKESVCSSRPGGRKASEHTMWTVRWAMLGVSRPIHNLEVISSSTSLLSSYSNATSFSVFTLFLLCFKALKGKSVLPHLQNTQCFTALLFNESSLCRPSGTVFSGDVPEHSKTDHIYLSLFPWWLFNSFSLLRPGSSSSINWSHLFSGLSSSPQSSWNSMCCISVSSPLPAFEFICRRGAQCQPKSELIPLEVCRTCSWCKCVPIALHDKCALL